MQEISDSYFKKTKHLFVENEFKKLEKFDAAYFRGKYYFGDDGTQNYLVFQPVYKYFEMVGNKVSSWESNGLSNEKINSAYTSNANRAPKQVYENARIKLKLDGVFLKQDKVTYNHVVYKLIPDTGDFGLTAQNSLFGTVKLTKCSDISKYKHSGYGSGFDSKGTFSDPDGGYGSNVIVFGVDMSGSRHSTNKTRNSLVHGKYFVQGIDSTTIYTEKC